MRDRKESDRAYYAANRDTIREKKRAYQKRAKDVIRAQQRRYRERNRDKVRKQKRDHQRKRLYGADAAVIARLLVEQDHKCAICGRPIDERADVDHDHKTGAVRGLLDRRCNIWLAAIEDYAFVRGALNYLRRFRP